jgi:hypothetical protein
MVSWYSSVNMMPSAVERSYGFIPNFSSCFYIQSIIQSISPNKKQARGGLEETHLAGTSYCTMGVKHHPTCSSHYFPIAGGRRGRQTPIHDEETSYRVCVENSDSVNRGPKHMTPHGEAAPGRKIPLQETRGLGPEKAFDPAESSPANPILCAEHQNAGF